MHGQTKTLWANQEPRAYLPPPHLAHDPKPDVELPVRHAEVEAMGRARITGSIVPGAAAEDVVRARRGTARIDGAALLVGRVVIRAPFPHVAIHVVQAPGIGLALPHRVSL